MTTEKRTIENYWVTPEEIWEAEPCDPWNEEDVYAWFGGRKKVRLSTILTDVNIPGLDRLWIIRDVIYMRKEIHWGWWPANPDVSLEKIIQAIE